MWDQIPLGVQFFCRVQFFLSVRSVIEYQVATLASYQVASGFLHGYQCTKFGTTDHTDLRLGTNNVYQIA